MNNVWNKDGANTLSQYRYGYDDAGNRTWVLQNRPANGGAANKGEIYRYDAANQLTNVVYDVTSPTNNPTGGTKVSFAGSRLNN